MPSDRSSTALVPARQTRPTAKQQRPRPSSDSEDDMHYRAFEQHLIKSGGAGGIAAAIAREAKPSKSEAPWGAPIKKAARWSLFGFGVAPTRVKNMTLGALAGAGVGFLVGQPAGAVAVLTGPGAPLVYGAGVGAAMTIGAGIGVTGGYLVTSVLDALTTEAPADAPLGSAAMSHRSNKPIVFLPKGVGGPGARRIAKMGIDPRKVQLPLCVRSIVASKGISVSRAFAICTASLQKNGYLKKGTHTPTAKGVARSLEMAEMAGVMKKINEYESFLAAARKPAKRKPATRKKTTKRRSGRRRAA